MYSTATGKQKIPWIKFRIFTRHIMGQSMACRGTLLFPRCVGYSSYSVTPVGIPPEVPVSWRLVCEGLVRGPKGKLHHVDKVSHHSVNAI